VAAHTCSLYSELATVLGTSLDPFCEPLYIKLSGMAGFTKKIIAQQSQASLSTIIIHTSAHHRTLIPLLLQLVNDKNTQARQYAVAHIKTYLETHGARSKTAIEASAGVDALDRCVRRALGDANTAVREAARICFWTFECVWPDRAAAIMHSLDATAQKQLQKVCPKLDASGTSAAPASAPPKKSSVAAAIAASRAKAKAIANAPPTLMHRATSTSHAMRATSPPLRRAGSPSLSSESAGSPRRTSALARSPGAGASPSPPRARVPSSSTRAVSGAVPVTHSRSASGLPTTSPSSSSSGFGQSQRRTSSSFGSPDHTLKTAALTALPASPPSKVLLKIPARTPPRPSLSTSMSAPSRASIAIGGGIEESLLMATKIPIPEDDDSEMDDLEDPTLSTPHQARPPYPPSVSSSQALSLSPPSESSIRPLFTHSPSTALVQVPSEPIIEDALRARAEQAESAADRLLELVEPEEDGLHVSPIPQSLLNGSSTPSKQVPGLPGLPRTSAVPVTPLNRTASIMKQAAMFQDSPVQNGHSKPLLFDMLEERKHETGWWLKRMSRK
jgi:CLIP-associating protein 1/2